MCDDAMDAQCLRLPEGENWTFLFSLSMGYAFTFFCESATELVFCKGRDGGNVRRAKGKKKEVKETRTKKKPKVNTHSPQAATQQAGNRHYELATTDKQGTALHGAVWWRCFVRVLFSGVCLMLLFFVFVPEKE
eukprot:gene8916-6252_t